MDSLYLDCALSSLVLIGPSLYVSLSLKDRYAPSILYFALLLVFQQLIFALSASLFHSYSTGMTLGILSILLLGFKIRHTSGLLSDPSPEGSTQRGWIHRLPWIVFLTVFIPYIVIRARYSFIEFINDGNHAGVEKLFNLSLQQSFLFGSAYPPEWIWLTGEPIKYYSFLRSIPGAASWLARTLFNNPATGGVFFILSEAFFAALTPAVICGSVIWFGRKQRNGTAIAVLGCLLGFYCFLSTHYHAISLGLSALLSSTSLDWWSLTKQIPFTDNQYPVWLMILGDNHAYMQIYFLQVLCWALFVDLVLEGKLVPLKAVGLGTIASGIALSHPASLLIDAAFIGPFIVVFTCFLIGGKQWHYLKTCAGNGLISLVTLLLFAGTLYNFGGAVKYVSPPLALASPALDFLKLNFSVFLWSAVLLLHPALSWSVARTLKSHAVFDEWIPILATILAACLYLLGLPALAIMVISSLLIYLALYQKQSSQQQQIATLFAICSFGIWFLPEIFAFDHVLDNRTDWIRFQMSLRFWPEGYLLIPFALSIAALPLVGEAETSRRWNWCCAAIVGVLCVSHIPGIASRIHRSQQPYSTLDGFAEFSRRFPDDGRIVAFLRSLPSSPKVVLAEACGVGDSRVPLHFAWPGRLSAFSGRPGVCGWTRHAMLYNNPLERKGFKGTSVEEASATFLRSYKGFFESCAASDLQNARVALLAMKSFGVSHIAFGQFERELIPSFRIEKLPATLPVSIEFQTSDGLGILKINE